MLISIDIDFLVAGISRFFLRGRQHVFEPSYHVIRLGKFDRATGNRITAMRRIIVIQRFERGENG